MSFYMTLCQRSFRLRLAKIWAAHIDSEVDDEGNDIVTSLRPLQKSSFLQQDCEALSDGKAISDGEAFSSIRGFISLSYFDRTKAKRMVTKAPPNLTRGAGSPDSTRDDGPVLLTRRVPCP